MMKSFKEDQEKEAAFDYKKRGTMRVPLDRIVGSVGKYHDFDGKFQPKPHVSTDRLERVKEAFRQGKVLPPVDLYQIRDEYYVLDGNHRVSAAKYFGHTDIPARIIEFIPSRQSLENILYKEKSEFIQRTGLTEPIELTELGQYGRLEHQIRQHHKYLQTNENRDISLKDAARDWYQTIYRPLITIIQRGQLTASFPSRTIGDLYAYISFHQWEMGSTRNYGIGINEQVPKQMEEFRKKMAGLKESEYPEMKRKILAFVLMNVKATREMRIIEKLYSLEEVKEIHSVHGDVDVLVKIVLTRDLLSSDAEIISHFVHNKMRQIPGVVATRTLIPGLSRIKPND